MSRPELGTKRVCPQTGKKFYDLNRDPVVSPYTGEVVATAALSAIAPVRAVATPSRAAEVEDNELPDAPETVSLTDLETEESGKEDTELESDEALTNEEESDDAGERDVLIEDDESDDATDLVEVADEDEE